MTTPVHQGDYIDTNHATKFTYKKDICLYQEYKEHIQNGVKVFTEKIEDNLLIDLEDTQRLILG